MTVAFGILLGSLFLLFAIPIRMGARGRLSEEGAEIRAWVRLLLGAIGVDVVYRNGFSWCVTIGSLGVFERRIVGKSKEEKEPDEKPGDGEEERDEKKPGKSVWEQLSLARDYYDRFRSPVLRLLRRLLKTVWLRRFQIDGLAGVGTPDVTGKMMGIVYAAQGTLGKRVRLNIQPDFVSSGFKGTAHVEIWFWLGFVIAAVLFAALTIGVRFGLWYLEQKLVHFRRPGAQTA
mgnify:CR=1 FL=1